MSSQFTSTQGANEKRQDLVLHIAAALKNMLSAVDKNFGYSAHVNLPQSPA